MLTELKKMCPDCFNMNYGEERCPDCGYVKAPVPGGDRGLLAGTLLGNRYLVGRVLGVGGFGITYKAYDNLYRNICAIKEYAPADLVHRTAGSTTMQVNTSSYVSQFEHGLMRFIQEAQMLKRLEDVPEVVRVKECFRENQTAYFSMEFLDGTNLKKLVKTLGQSIDQRDITELIIGIGGAMDVIHKTAGILHRDISPENICVLKDGTAKLLDFGSARQAAMGEGQGFSVELKPGFAPLEQYSKSGKQGPYTDVYALACTYYYALTGVMIPSAVDRLDGRKYEPLNRICSSVPSAVSEGVDRALELDYRKRIQTMGEFVSILSEKHYIRQSRPGEEEKPVPYLEVLTGKTSGNRWKLPLDTEILLGRSPVSSNIVLTSDTLISKAHCKIIYNQTSNLFLLSDMSLNGTFVESKRLEHGKYYEFEPEFQFSLASPACMVKAGVSYE